MFALEGDQLAIFLLKPLAFVNDGFKQLFGKRALNKIQIESLKAG
jgi:hypothetical protein